MKKKLALLLAGVLAIASLTACGNGSTDGTESGSASADTVTVGLGSCTSFSESYSIGEDHYGSPAEATNAQVDIHVAAVMLDADGKIVSCAIDAIQIKATVDENGEIAEDATTTFTSKKDLKEDYAMKSASPIGKEWYEQVENYEQWCIGKTVEEVKAGVGEDGKPSDETLLTGCTITTTDITEAVVDACENATATGASANDTLGIAIIGDLANYAAPTEDEDGTFQAYVNYATTTQNANGEITCVLIDSIQAYPTWGADGVLTTDTETEVKTKYEKKDEYGMQVASSLENGEWFEQIDVFKQFILGKTADEVAAIAVDESGYPTDDILTTGCTMKVAAYKTAVVKSLEK